VRSYVERSETNPTGQVEGPDPTGICADGGKEAKSEKQETAAGAIAIINRFGSDRHHVQHGRDPCNIRVCVAGSDRSKALHVREENMLLELFPLIASAMATFGFLVLTAE
jgi:hypothetical protein